GGVVAAQPAMNNAANAAVTALVCMSSHPSKRVDERTLATRSGSPPCRPDRAGSDARRLGRTQIRRINGGASGGESPGRRSTRRGRAGEIPGTMPAGETAARCVRPTATAARRAVGAAAEARMPQQPHSPAAARTLEPPSVRWQWPSVGLGPRTPIPGHPQGGTLANASRADKAQPTARTARPRITRDGSPVGHTGQAVGGRSTSARPRPTEAILPPVPSAWPIPEGVRVLKDGAWRVGGFPVVNAPSLRHLKERLVFEDDGVFIADGAQRMPVVLEGPPLEVLSLRLDDSRGEACAFLDDGSEEKLDGAEMNAETGRFECRARGGKARAVFSRAAHQVLLDRLAEEDGRFYLLVGSRRVPIRT